MITFQDYQMMVNQSTISSLTEAQPEQSPAAENKLTACTRRTGTTESEERRQHLEGDGATDDQAATDGGSLPALLQW
jgi:hypothetical protein